jgi:hypothetical protein
MVFLYYCYNFCKYYDVTVAIDAVDSMVIKRSSTSTDRIKKKKQNLCLDKAYHSKEIEQEIIKRGYIPHIRHRKERRKSASIIQLEDGL